MLLLLLCAVLVSVLDSALVLETRPPLTPTDPEGTVVAAACVLDSVPVLANVAVKMLLGTVVATVTVPDVTLPRFDSALDNREDAAAAALLAEAAAAEAFDNGDTGIGVYAVIADEVTTETALLADDIAPTAPVDTVEALLAAAEEAAAAALEALERGMTGIGVRGVGDTDAAIVAAAEDSDAATDPAEIAIIDSADLAETESAEMIEAAFEEATTAAEAALAETADAWLATTDEKDAA